jgi:type II secretory pathway pseudopilin PulG
MRRGGREIVNRKSSIVDSGGFTLVELLVVIGVLALSMGVLLPALGQARRAARSVVSGGRQRQIVLAANLYATDHAGWYPESVATAAGLGRTWRWQEPRKMKACQPRAEGYRTSMASYLRHYLPDAEVLFCPSSPQAYPYMKDFWRAGDSWDNPNTGFTDDSVVGSYCFYWNYVGYLTEQDRPFRGPQTNDDRSRGSSLLTTDYFGFDHWRSPEAFGSCEYLPHAEVTAEAHEAPAYWFARPTGNPDPTRVSVKLRAGFVDGHVESYRPDETAALEIAESLDGSAPAPRGLDMSPGQFFIPTSGINSRP